MNRQYIFVGTIKSRQKKSRQHAVHLARHNSSREPDLITIIFERTFKKVSWSAHTLISLKVEVKYDLKTSTFCIYNLLERRKVCSSLIKSKLFEVFLYLEQKTSIRLDNTIPSVFYIRPEKICRQYQYLFFQLFGGYKMILYRTWE